MLFYYSMGGVNAQTPLGWNDANGGYSINTVEIANKIQNPCTPVGPCYINCSVHTPSSCSSIYTEIKVSIFSTNSTLRSANLTIQSRQLGSGSTWITHESETISAKCNISLPVYNCCSNIYTYSVPITNNREFRVKIDPTWSAVSGSTTDYFQDVNKPAVNFNYKLNDFNAYTSSVTALDTTYLKVICKDTTKTLKPTNTQMLEYLNSFTGSEDVIFNNNFTIGFQKTDIDGNFIGAEVKASNLGYNQLGFGWNGTAFDLDELYNEATSTSNGIDTGYYLIKFFDDYSGTAPCYTNNANYLWIKVIDTLKVDLYLKTAVGGVLIPPGAGPDSTTIDNPIIGCNLNTNIYFNVEGLTDTSKIYMQIERYNDTTLTYETTIKDTSFTYSTANVLGSEYNLITGLDINDLWGPTNFCVFVPTICENKSKIYKVRYSFENLCGKTQVDSFWLTPNATSCKTEFNDDSMWLALYSDYFTEHNLNNKTISNIKIYPNPTKNYITIENVLNYDIKLMDITGKVLKELNSSSNNFILETNDYSKGTYLLILKDKESGTIKTEKILVH